MYRIYNWKNKWKKTSQHDSTLNGQTVVVISHLIRARYYMVNRLDRPCQYEPASREIRLEDVMPWENSVSYWTRYPSLRGDGLQTASCFENETGLPLTLIGKDEKTKIKRFFKKFQAIHSCGRTQRRLKTQTVRIRWCERRGDIFLGVRPLLSNHDNNNTWFASPILASS